VCFVSFVFFRGGRSLCEPFGALLWGRGAVKGKRDWSFELWVVCVCFWGVGLSKVYLLNLQLLFCEKGRLCVPYLFLFFSFQSF
jgi:hypothetical protein